MGEVRVLDLEDKVPSSEDIQKKIEDLRVLILEHEDLRKLRTDDAFLLRFLHRTRFNVDLAYETVKEYYKYIIEESDWIAVDISDNVKTFLDMKMRVMLPAVDKHGKKIFYMRTDTVNPSKISIAQLNQFEYIWLESVLDDPKVQANGLCMLIDVSGFSLKMMNWMTPTNIKKGIKKMQNIIVTDATIHVVRSSMFMKIVVNTVWPLLPNVIKERVVFHHNNFDSLYKYISPDNIPKEYGGYLDVNFEALNSDLLSKDEELRRKLEHYKLITL